MISYCTFFISRKKNMWNFINTLNIMYRKFYFSQWNYAMHQCKRMTFWSNCCCSCHQSNWKFLYFRWHHGKHTAHNYSSQAHNICIYQRATWSVKLFLWTVCVDTMHNRKWWYDMIWQSTYHVPGTIDWYFFFSSYYLSVFVIMMMTIQWM